MNWMFLVFFYFITVLLCILLFKVALVVLDQVDLKAVLDQEVSLVPLEALDLLDSLDLRVLLASRVSV